MTEVAALLLQYFPPSVVITAAIVWLFARLTFKTTDAKNTAIRAHRRVNDLEEKIQDLIDKLSPLG